MFKVRAKRRVESKVQQRLAIDDDYISRHAQSGILFRVSPPLKHGTVATRYDADWFEPVPQQALQLKA